MSTPDTTLRTIAHPQLYEILVRCDSPFQCHCGEQIPAEAPTARDRGVYKRKCPKCGDSYPALYDPIAINAKAHAQRDEVEAELHRKLSACATFIDKVISNPSLRRQVYRYKGYRAAVNACACSLEGEAES